MTRRLRKPVESIEEFCARFIIGVTVNDHVLSFISAHVHQRSKDEIKKVIVSHFTKEEILKAKSALWDSLKDTGVLDKYIQRVDTSSRGAEDANTDDTINAIIKASNSDDPPTFVMNATEILRLPKYSPGELLEPSILQRLAIVEAQIEQLHTSQLTVENKVRCMSHHDEVIKRPLLPTPAAETTSDSSQTNVPSATNDTKVSQKASSTAIQSVTHTRCDKVPERVDQAPKASNSITSLRSHRHDDNDDFVTPRYLRRRVARNDRNKIIIGANKNPTSLKASLRVPTSTDLFIYNVD